MHFSHCLLRFGQVQSNISSLNLEKKNILQTDKQPYPLIFKKFSQGHSCKIVATMENWSDLINLFTLFVGVQ